MRVAAVIGAAGSGSRMGNVNKCLLPLAGRPILFWTLRAFQQHSAINEIVLLGRKEYTEEYTLLAEESGITKLSQIVEGGKERQDSMHNGLRAVNPASEIVLFHNGANPLVTGEDITAVIEAAKTHGAAAVGIPAKDTLRKVDEQSFSKGTIQRDSVWQMQTPQALNYKLALEAFEKANAEGFQATDEIQLVEMLGKSAKLLPTRSQNFKITTLEDLQLAEAIMKLQK